MSTILSANFLLILFFYEKCKKHIVSFELYIDLRNANSKKKKKNAEVHGNNCITILKILTNRYSN